MAKRPGERYQSAAEFAAALEHYLRPPDSIPAQTRRPGYSVRLGVAALVLFTATLIIYLGNKWIGNEELSREERLRRAQSARLLELGPAFGVNVPGTIGRAGQRDWFQVQAVRDANLKVCVGNIGSPLQPSVTVYDADLNTIRSADGTLSNNAELIIQARATQTFYVAASGVGDSTGGYGLLVAQPEPPRPDFPPRDDYPNARYEARVITFDSRGEIVLRGAIDPVGDEDWFTFTTARSGRLLINIGTPYSSLDPHLELYDRTDTDKPLAQDHDRIGVPVKAGARFWLKVRAGSENGPDDIRPREDPTGKYELRLRLTETDG